MANILVIDDDRQMRLLIARMLTRAGHEVHEAETGRDGLNAFREAPIALVVTDILMPEMEGLETIRTIRHEAPTIPILAISGSDQSLYLRAASELGAAATLEKPFTADDLLEHIDRLLGK